MLRFVGSIKNVDGPYGLIGAHGVSVSPDGRDVYAVSFDNNALVVLGRNAESGVLTYSEAYLNGTGDITGLFRSVAVTVSPDGRDVYVASFFGDAVVAFRRDLASGSLTFTESLFGGAAGTLGLTQLEAVAVSPDGASVYVASFGDNAVTALSRDPSSGRLTLIDTEIEGQGGVTGVFRAAGVCVSPDGANVYAVGGGDDGLAVFRRDAATGALDFVEAFFDGLDGVAGLITPVAVAASPDGHDVYGLGDNGVAHFRRNADSGRLTFANVQTEGVVNESGTSGPTGLAVSPDGEFVYVTRDGDDTLGVLKRDAADGSLQFVETHVDGQDGIDGLAGPTAVAVSPDSRSVYVAAQFDDAVAAFQRAALCVGDCDGNGAVTVDELIRGVNVALGSLGLAECPSFDANGDGEVTVDEIVQAVNYSLGECPA